MMFRGRSAWQTAALLLALGLPASLLAAPPTTCGASDDYSVALCAYQHRQFADAESRFRQIVERDEPDPQTIRATYFLARTEMKLGRFRDAEALFIRIYGMSQAFYDEWNCDYLLGACRSARGQS